MIAKIKKNIAVAYAVLGFLLYWLAALFVDVDLLVSIFNNLSFGVAVMVVITWAPSAYQAFRSNVNDGSWTLIIAIFLAFCTILYSRLFAIALEVLDRPQWLINSVYRGFIPYSVTVVGLLFLIAPGQVDPAMRRSGYVAHVMVAIAVGALVTGIMIGRSLVR